MSLPIFTIQTFNQNTLQPAGAVFAQRVEAVSMARNVFAGISGSVGGRNMVMEKKMNDLTKVLMEELQSQTKTAYPNAVALVDVKMHFSDIGKDDSNMFLAGQASATALIKRNKPVAQAPASSSGPMAMAAPLAMAAPMPMPMPMPGPMPMAAPMPMPGPGLGPMAINQSRNSRVANSKPNNSTNPVPVSTGGKYRSKLGKSRKNRN
uniref:Uncharacterized protein n=1 Tax=viral metagenome TaxID=1070528 RepID=A0A6C0APM9_9ZZZZ